ADGIRHFHVTGVQTCALPISRVLCIGAGGLGAPSSVYLAAAGVGTIGMVDDVVVDSSNLQRQIIHFTDRVGMAKVESAEKTLTELGSSACRERGRGCAGHGAG